MDIHGCGDIGPLGSLDPWVDHYIHPCYPLRGDDTLYTMRSSDGSTPSTLHTMDMGVRNLDVHLEQWNTP